MYLNAYNNNFQVFSINSHVGVDTVDKLIILTYLTHNQLLYIDDRGHVYTNNDVWIADARHFSNSECKNISTLAEYIRLNLLLIVNKI